MMVRNLANFENPPAWLINRISLKNMGDWLIFKTIRELVFKTQFVFQLHLEYYGINGLLSFRNLWPEVRDSII